MYLITKISCSLALSWNIMHFQLINSICFLCITVFHWELYVFESVVWFFWKEFMIKSWETNNITWSWCHWFSMLHLDILSYVYDIPHPKWSMSLWRIAQWNLQQETFQITFDTFDHSQILHKLYKSVFLFLKCMRLISIFAPV